MNLLRLFQQLCPSSHFFFHIILDYPDMCVKKQLQLEFLTENMECKSYRSIYSRKKKKIDGNIYT